MASSVTYVHSEYPSGLGYGPIAPDVGVHFFPANSVNHARYFSPEEGFKHFNFIFKDTTTWGSKATLSAPFMRSPIMILRSIATPKYDAAGMPQARPDGSIPKDHMHLFFVQQALSQDDPTIGESQRYFNACKAFDSFVLMSLQNMHPGAKVEGMPEYMGWEFNDPAPIINGYPDRLKISGFVNGGFGYSGKVGDIEVVTDGTSLRSNKMVLDSVNDKKDYMVALASLPKLPASSLAVGQRGFVTFRPTQVEYKFTAGADGGQSTISNIRFTCNIFNFVKLDAVANMGAEFPPEEPIGGFDRDVWLTAQNMNRAVLTKAKKPRAPKPPKKQEADGAGSAAPKPPSKAAATASAAAKLASAAAAATALPIVHVAKKKEKKEKKRAKKEKRGKSVKLIDDAASETDADGSDEEEETKTPAKRKGKKIELPSDSDGDESFDASFIDDGDQEDEPSVHQRDVPAHLFKKSKK